MKVLSFSEYQDLLEGVSALNEKLITFNRNQDVKFGNVVILAGGAGSGKGFVLSNLIGIQGKSFDVDELKSFALKSKQIAARLKDEYGIDVQSNPDFLKTPENVSKLHLAISDLKLPKTKESLFLAHATLADPSRKPNIIFDVTLKDMAKLVNISQSIQAAGYDLKKVHIVWVVNKIDVAMKQNAQRDRVVDSDILLDTHEGAARVMRKIVDMGDGVRRLFDGDMYFAFNQVGVDSELVKSGFGGKYVKEANYVQVKKVGQVPLAYDEIENQIVSKIVEYTPKSLTW